MTQAKLDENRNATLIGASEADLSTPTLAVIDPNTNELLVKATVMVNQLDLATLGTAHVRKYYTSAGAVTDGIIWSPASGKGGM